MNDVLSDWEIAAPWVMRRVRRVPGAVTGLRCRARRAGELIFFWESPAGSTPVNGYRLERTRDGRAYEPVAETTEKSLVLSHVPLHDGWFYRVSAFNARGQGSAEWVYFYLRRRDPILQLVPVRPGLRVNICELIPQ